MPKTVLSALSLTLDDDVVTGWDDQNKIE